MRMSGIAFDEELAQFALAGKRMLSEPELGVLDRAKHDVHQHRFELMRLWEGKHPGQKPFAPSFPQRILDEMKKIYDSVDEGEVSALEIRMMLDNIITMCKSELDDDDDKD